MTETNRKLKSFAFKTSSWLYIINPWPVFFFIILVNAYIFFGRTDGEADVLELGLPAV